MHLAAVSAFLTSLILHPVAVECLPRARVIENDTHLERRACMPQLNPSVVDLIKQFEGFVPSVQPDPVGLPTVGYGHLCQIAGCSEIPFQFPMTQDQGNALLHTDLLTFRQCIADNINSNIPLNQYQYGALTSWAFNVGCENVRNSSLISRINEGEDPSVVVGQELPKWNTGEWTSGGGSPLDGLVVRRAREVQLFQTPDSHIVLPCWRSS